MTSSTYTETFLEPLVLSPNAVELFHITSPSPPSSKSMIITNLKGTASKKQLLSLHPSSLESCLVPSGDNYHCVYDDFDCRTDFDCIERQSGIDTQCSSRNMKSESGIDVDSTVTGIESSSINSHDDCHSSCSSVSTTIDYTRRVRFSPLVRVKETISHHDMTPKEQSDYWLQGHEFLMIKNRNRYIIQAIEKQQKSSQTTVSPSLLPSTSNESLSSTSNFNKKSCNSGSNFCIRGLEAGLPNENLRRRSYRFAALEEVLLEQEDQYFAGIYDDVAIAEAYFEATCECRFQAQYRALKDRKEIEEYILLADSPQQ